MGFKHADFEWVFDLDVLATLDLKLPDSIKVMIILLLIVRSEFLFLASKSLIDRYLNNIQGREGRFNLIKVFLLVSSAIL